jgi:nucleoid-associated protein EbfC
MTESQHASDPADFDINALLQQAMSMQQQLATAQQAVAAQKVEGNAGGVRVTMTGGGEVTAVRIAADAAQDIELLEDMVHAAFRDAQTKVAALQADAMGSVTSGLGEPPGGMGGIGGLLGGG